MVGSRNDVSGRPATAAATQSVPPLPIPPIGALDRWTLPNWGEEFDERRALEIVDANVEVSKERFGGATYP